MLPTRGAGDPGHVHCLLDDHRDARQRTKRPARSPFPVDFTCIFNRTFVHERERVVKRLETRDSVEMRAGELLRRELARREAGERRGDGEIGEVDVWVGHFD